MSTTSIQQLYIGYYSRAADPGGENYWLTQEVNPALTFSQEAMQFAVQPETLSLYPVLSTPVLLASSKAAQDILIDSNYMNLFGHKASGLDAAGLTYWEGQLQATVNIGLIISQMISGALGTDAIAIASKAGVAQSYTNAVLTAVPTVTWNAANDTAQSKAILATVKDSTTAAASGSAITAAITTDQTGSTGTAGVTLFLPAGGGASIFSPSQTNPLFQTTANNDTIKGIAAGDLNSTSVINAGGGQDTLSATIGATINPVLTSVEIVNLDPTTGAAVFNATGDTGLQLINEAGGSIAPGTGNSLSITGLSTSVSVGMSNIAASVDSLGVTYTGLAASGNAATLVLNGNASLGSVFDTTLNSSGSGVNTYNISSTGKSNFVTIGGVDTQLTTENLTGSTALTIVNGNFAVTTINGAGATGALTITAGAVGKSTITGGAGADSIDASAAGKGTTLNGGLGNDTLIFNGIVSANTLTGGGGSDTIATKAGGGGMTFISAGDVTTLSTLVGDVDTVTDYTAGSTLISLAGLGAGALVTLTGTQLSTVAAASDILAATKLAATQPGMGAGKVTSFTFASDAYIYQENAGGGFKAGDGLMKLTGAGTTFKQSDLSLT